MDLGLRLLHDGFRAVEMDRKARGGGSSYASRLLGRRTVVLGDPEGAAAFYDESLVRRAGAVPAPLGWLLFGRGAVHGLDGAPHRDRKLLFLEALSPGGIPELADSVSERLDTAVASWPGREVVLFDELVSVYGGAVLEWAGIRVDPAEADRISHRLAAIVDGFGGAVTAYPRAWRERLAMNRWAAQVVADTRSGRATPPDGSPLAVIAGATELDEKTAGVELLNVLRPTVAVAWLGTFAALALYMHPFWRVRLESDTAVRERYAFAQEVRRTTPFAPVLTGRATRSATHDGLRIARGDRLLLDIVGIDHDPGRWPDPHAFHPDRFLDDHDYAGRVPGAFELVPQGGGHPSGHRCPGESVALRLLMETAGALAPVQYDVVRPYDADLARIPALPARGLLLTDIQLPARAR